MAEDQESSEEKSTDDSSSDKDETSTSTAKKTAAKKSTAKKSPAKKSAASQSTSSQRMSGAELAAAAARQLGELTDKAIEGVTGLQKGDDGWRVEVEVLELSRVPTTTDVLATYEVDVDASGDLQGYRRSRRYVRGKAEGAS